MGRLNGKSVILTGGAGDIAMAVASRFLSEGANILLVDVDEGGLQRSCETLGNDAVKVCVADVTSESDTERYVNKAVAEFGGVDVLLANAGVEGVVAPVSDYDTSVFEKVMSVNVTGVFLGLKYVFPVMAARGGGSVVITSSIAGVKGMPMLSAYNASKHATIGLMRSCALEGAEHNIRVNTVNPAPVESRMIESLEAKLMPDTPQLAKESITASVPLNRYAEPQDVANMMLFLASDESVFLTGGIYMVDGGQSAA